MKVTAIMISSAAVLMSLCAALSLRAEDGQLKWYKGNTHTHSLWSDGNDFPEMITDWYKKKGYDFLALSDHNVLSRGERWMNNKAIERRKKTLGHAPLKKYLKRFGDKWVETRGEGDNLEVRLKPLSEFRTLFEEKEKFLLIEAEEITDGFEKKPVHINAVNLKELIPPQKGGSVRETMRNNLRAAEEQAKRTGRSILVHLNHPNFGWGITARDLAHVIEEQFFEVYNGHPGINHLGDENRPGDEMIWDIANTVRLAELNSPPLFGVATDDSHTYHGGNVSPGRGWVMVQSPKLEPNTLMDAMKAGRFYASSGVELKSIVFDNATKTLRLAVQDSGAGETFETQFIGSRGLQDGGMPPPEKIGEVFATVKGTEAAYTMRGDELYVRATVTSSAFHENPSFKNQKKQAWSQPVGWTVRPAKKQDPPKDETSARP